MESRNNIYTSIELAGKERLIYYSKEDAIKNVHPFFDVLIVFVDLQGYDVVSIVYMLFIVVKPAYFITNTVLVDDFDARKFN